MMNIPKIVGDFFLSLWIWQITYDLYHPVIAALAMFLLLRLVLRRKRVRSLVISLSAQLVAIIALTAIVPAFLVGVLQWNYDPLNLPEALSMAQLLIPSLSLGLFYSVVQALFFVLGRFFCSYSLLSYLIVTVVSNGVAAIISYFLIRAVEFAYYVG